MVQRIMRAPALRIAFALHARPLRVRDERGTEFAAGGQRGMLTGIIVDATSGSVAQADVTISSPSGSYTAHTDSKGHFRFMGADSDTYVLTIKKDGYTQITQPNIAVNGDQTTDLGTITLQKS